MFKSLILGLATLCAHSIAIAQSTDWGLDRVVEQTWLLSTDKKTSDAAISTADVHRQHASKWANPELELIIDNAIGKEVGSGNSELSEILIRQAIPVNGRIAIQQQQAEAALTRSKLTRNQQQLLLQREIAQLFHNLQFQQMRMALLQQQLTAAGEFQRIADYRERGGDISHLERLRLGLISESSRQLIASAEGDYHEAMSALRARLYLDDKTPLQLDALDSLPSAPALSELLPHLPQHPELLMLQSQIEMAEQQLALQKATRFEDPELWLSYQNSYLNGEREGVSGVGIAFTLPLWDRKQGQIATARQELQQSRLLLKARQRQLTEQLNLNYRHLGHLIDQAQRHRTLMLAPAEEIFNLSREAFAVGEADILQLVDAVETKFQTELSHLALLHQAWLEWSELRYAAAITLTSLSLEEGNK